MSIFGGYTVTGSSILTVPNTAGGVEVVALNSKRINVMIQNIGINPVFLCYGGVPSTTNLNVILPSATVLKDGTGGLIIEGSFKGQIKAICPEAGGSYLLVTEVVNNE